MSEMQEIITYGDLHGDTAAFLKHLQQKKVFENANAQHIIEELIDLINIHPSIEAVLRFHTLVQHLRFKDTIKHRLLGDALADRGPNDVFTLLLIRPLYEKKLLHAWLLSNHDAEAAYMFHTNNLRFERDRIWQFNSYRSFLVTIQELILSGHQPLVDELLDTLENILDTTQLLDLSEISLDGRKKVYIYSHAPITKKTLIDLVSEATDYSLAPPCDHRSIFNNKDNLIKTVTFINTLLSNVPDKIAFIAKKIQTIEDGCGQEKPNILRLLFRRDGEDPDRTYNLSCNDGTTVVNIHGHDGFACDPFHNGILSKFRASLNTIPLPDIRSCWQLYARNAERTIFSYRNHFLVYFIINKETSNTYTGTVVFDQKKLYHTTISKEEFHQMKNMFEGIRTLGFYRYLFTIASISCNERPLLIATPTMASITPPITPPLAYTRSRQADTLVHRAQTPIDVPLLPMDLALDTRSTRQLHVAQSLSEGTMILKLPPITSLALSSPTLAETLDPEEKLDMPKLSTRPAP